MSLLLALSLAHAAPADQLRLRDSVPCSALGEPTPALRDELVILSDPAGMPSWLPIRAAACLVELYAADPALEAIVSPWMTDSTRAGLALVVVGGIDRFPAPVALRLATSALSTPDPRHRARVAKRLSSSAIPAVRAQATAP